MRLSRDEYFIAAAQLAAKRSTCLRLQVGAILVREGRIISTGYNGAPSGLDHCDPSCCGPDHPCNRTVHAEANCIYFAAKHGIATEGAWMYCTDSPCKTCAEAIINAGIRHVVYLREYRDRGPLNLLEACCVGFGTPVHLYEE